MKANRIKNVVIGTLLTVTFGTAFASVTGETFDTSEYLEVRVFPMKNDIISVNFKKQEDEIVTVKIFDTTGALIFKEDISESSLVVKRYDLSKFPDGIYSFEVSKEKYMMRKRVEKK